MIEMSKIQGITTPRFTTPGADTFQFPILWHQTLMRSRSRRGFWITVVGEASVIMCPCQWGELHLHNNTKQTLKTHQHEHRKILKKHIMEFNAQDGTHSSITGVYISLFSQHCSTKLGDASLSSTAVATICQWNSASSPMRGCPAAKLYQPHASLWWWPSHFHWRLGHTPDMQHLH